MLDIIRCKSLTRTDISTAYSLQKAHFLIGHFSKFALVTEKQGPKQFAKIKCINLIFKKGFWRNLSTFQPKGQSVHGPLNLDRLSISTSRILEFYTTTVLDFSANFGDIQVYFF